MYIHRKRNKNTSKSSDLKKTTFTAFDSRHLHIRKKRFRRCKLVTNSCFLARIMKSLITLANRLKFLAIEGQRRQIKLANVKKGWRERDGLHDTIKGVR